MKAASTHPWTFALPLAVALSHPQEVAACSIEPPSPYEIVGNANDTVPPSPPEVSEPQIYQAERDSSCGHNASVTLDVMATDNKTPADDIGYLLQYVGRGSGIRVEYRPVSAIDGTVYVFFQDDGNEHDFEVDIWSIDRAGNVSESALRVGIHVDENGLTNPEAGAQGCATTSSSHLGSPFMLLLLGWYLRRRRRASRAMP